MYTNIGPKKAVIECGDCKVVVKCKSSAHPNKRTRTERRPVLPQEVAVWWRRWQDGEMLSSIAADVSRYVSTVSMHVHRYNSTFTETDNEALRELLKTCQKSRERALKELTKLREEVTALEAELFLYK